MILIDTSVLVYAHDPADVAKHSVARHLLRRLAGDVGVLSAQCLAEFFSVMTRPNRGAPARVTPAEAVAQMALLADSFPVLDLTRAAVMEAGMAARDHHLSYYDAQIWAVAKLNGVPVVMSDDFQDGMTLEGVRFVNPFAPGFDISRWVTA